MIHWPTQLAIRVGTCIMFQKLYFLCTSFFKYLLYGTAVYALDLTTCRYKGWVLKGMFIVTSIFEVLLYNVYVLGIHLQKVSVLYFLKYRFFSYDSHVYI